MRRPLLTVIAVFAGYSAAMASGIAPGRTFSTFDRHTGSAICGSPVALASWVSGYTVRQQYQRCTVKAHFTLLTPTVLTSTPLPRPTLRPSPTTIPTIAPSPTPWPTPIPSATSVPSNDPVQQLLALLNQHRASYGSAPLQLISDAITARHAAYMAGDGTIWHTSTLHPDASFPYDGFQGENVGAGQYVQQVDQGMWSEGTTTCSLGTVSHSCNIANPAFHSVAIGLASGLLFGYPATYLVEDFRS